MSEIEILSDAHDVSRRGASLLLELATAADHQARRLSVALSGGSTPKTMFQILASDEFRGQMPWETVAWFWGDERCVPPDHEDSNYNMTHKALLEVAPIPEGNIYRMPAENADREAAATSYERMLRAYFASSSGIPSFDLIYLGMGDDGHTASLFPGTKALAESRRLVVPNYVDKFQSYRLTFTIPMINAGRQVVFLIAGEGKADRLHEVMEGQRDPDRLPSQYIQPHPGQLRFFLDQAAAARLGNAG